MAQSIIRLFDTTVIVCNHETESETYFRKNPSEKGKEPPPPPENMTSIITPSAFFLPIINGYQLYTNLTAVK